MASQGGDSNGYPRRVRRLESQFAIAEPHELTYISSAHGACKAAGLRAYEPKMRRGKCAWRYVFASKVFLEWVNSEMPAITPDHPDNDPPKVQLEAELYGFCCGFALAFGSDVRCLEPQRLSVWELKTADLRLFGWFCQKNYLVLHKGERKAKLQKWEDYAPFVDEVNRFRSDLSIHIPIYVVGRLADVVSNRPQSV